MMNEIAGPIPHVRKIAVLRANRLGDFIAGLPALEALRATYATAEIVLLGSEWHVPFLRERPGPVDRVVAIPAEWDPISGVRHGQPTPALDRVIAALADEQFDLAIQMHGGGRNSNPLISRLGARYAVGLRAPDAPPLDRWVPYVFYQHEVLRALEVVALVGAVTSHLEPRVAVTAADLAAAGAVVPETGEPLAALHPGASDSRRYWPVEKFAAVGDALADLGAHVVVTGTEDERALADGVVATMHGAAQNLCGRLSLNALTGLLSRCRVMVANDTGPLHLAEAVGAATVGIYWCGNVITFGPLTRARRRPAISWRIHCPECGADTTSRRCAHQSSFVADVPTEEVISSAVELFSASPP
jgi:ADP-heptose:LPS heptosyltransferase